jgi:hypothetical protein
MIVISFLDVPFIAPGSSVLCFQVVVEVRGRIRLKFDRQHISLLFVEGAIWAMAVDVDSERDPSSFDRALPVTIHSQFRENPPPVARLDHTSPRLPRDPCWYHDRANQPWPIQW